MDSEGIQPECTQPPPVAEPAAVRLRTAADANTPDPIPPLTEDVVLALLERRDVPPETLEEFSQNPAALKSRKVCVILAAHPHTPRHLALRLIRQFYTFDLMRFTHHPAVAADLKRVADEQLIARLTSVTLGERLTLARRGSQAVAAALLLDTESRVSHTALENSSADGSRCHQSTPAAERVSFCRGGVPSPEVVAAARDPRGVAAQSTYAPRPGPRVCPHSSSTASARHSAHITFAGEDQGLPAQ